MELRWEGSDLFCGRVYVGSIMRIVPEGWREMSIYKEPVPISEPDYVKRNRENMRKHHERNDAKPWRGWVMTSEDGAEVGYWATENEARNHTMAIAYKMMRNET